MAKNIDKVTSAEAAREWTNMNCQFKKAKVFVGSLEAIGWISDCTRIFVRESDGSFCGEGKFDFFSFLEE